MARESIDRKMNTQSTKNGYWNVGLRDEYEAFSSSRVTFFLAKPQKVGLFVDYEEGQISFYNVEARSHVYSFIGYTFTEKLYPLFEIGLTDDENSLVVSLVSHMA